MGKIIYEKGDLVKRADINIFVHQCNCFGTMGAGIAKQIATTYPEAAKADRSYMNERGSLGIFGTILPVKLSDGRICVNMYSQYHYGKGKQTDSEAFKGCLNQLIRYTDYLNPDLKIGFPKLIGCGLAGGDWNEIEKYLETFAGLVKNPVYIIDFAKAD